MSVSPGQIINCSNAFDNSNWVVLLNPDAVPASDWLEQLVATAEKHPQFSCFGSRLLTYKDPSRIDGDGDIYHVSGLAWRDGHGQKVCTRGIANREVFSTCAAAAMFRVSALRAVGGFDEDFFCYVEDVDLGFRLRLAGYRSLSVPTSIACHHGSATSGGRHSDFAVYHGHRNLVWTYTKNMPGFLFWLFLPLLITQNIFSLVYFCLRKQHKIILRAKKDAIGGISSMWRKRIDIQRNRRVSLHDIARMMDMHPIPRAMDMVRQIKKISG